MRRQTRPRPPRLPRSTSPDSHWIGAGPPEILTTGRGELERGIHSRLQAADFLLMQPSHGANPTLTEWRMLYDTLSTALAGKRKLILASPTQQPAGFVRRPLALDRAAFVAAIRL